MNSRNASAKETVSALSQSIFVDTASYLASNGESWAEVWLWEPALRQLAAGFEENQRVLIVTAPKFHDMEKKAIFLVGCRPTAIST